MPGTAEIETDEPFPPIIEENPSFFAKTFVDIIFELLRRQMLDLFFELPENAFSVGAFVEFTQTGEHPGQQLMTYEQCVSELAAREDFFHYDSKSMQLFNLNNEELLKTVFLFQYNNLDQKEWCTEILTRLNGDLFLASDVEYGLKAIPEYFRLFNGNFNQTHQEKLIQILTSVD